MADAPDWFWQAVDAKPDVGQIDVEDCSINYQLWSDAGDLPPLLFVHGHNAHAHWWDFIAPAFTTNRRVAALDLSGMGDSDHRDAYSADLYAREIHDVARHLGFGKDLVVVAHSFGGIMSVHAARTFPDLLSGLVLVDSGVRSPEDQRPPEPERWSKPKVYPSFEIAKSRFRLQPPQPCDNTWIVSYIAHHSVEGVDEGFVWKFDEEHSTRMVGALDLEGEFRGLECRLALIYGEQSDSISKRSADYMKSLQPGMRVVPIADARHHLFLDQPLAFIDALTSVLGDWR